MDVKDCIAHYSRSVTSLRLDDCDPGVLPPDIGRLTGLESLAINASQLRSLPSEVVQLVNLRRVELRLDTADHFGELAKLPSLEQLTILLVASPIPGEIRALTSLKELYVRKSRSFSPSEKVAELPDDVGKLVELTSLMYTGCGLRALPASIGQLSKLTTLSVSMNQLTTLPDSIGELAHLAELNVRDNLLTALPSEVGQLQSLTDLNASRNQLTGLPASIGEMAHLAELNVSDNLLTALPSEIGQLLSLTDLNASSNQLTGLPASIGQLENLIKLSVRDNQLTSLPSEVGELSCLTDLDASANVLQGLPGEMERLGLLRLDLGKNDLGEMPPALFGMTELIRLRLNKAKVGHVPAAIADLDSLQELNLSNNELTVLPRELGELAGLRTLAITGNQLTDASPVARLPNLFGVWLYANPLDEGLLDLVERRGVEGLQQYIDGPPVPDQASYPANATPREARNRLLDLGVVGSEPRYSSVEVDEFQSHFGFDLPETYRYMLSHHTEFIEELQFAPAWKQSGRRKGGWGSTCSHFNIYAPEIEVVSQWTDRARGEHDVLKKGSEYANGLLAIAGRSSGGNICLDFNADPRAPIVIYADATYVGDYPVHYVAPSFEQFVMMISYEAMGEEDRVVPDEITEQAQAWTSERNRMMRLK